MAKSLGRPRITGERAGMASFVESSHDAIVGITGDAVVSSWNPAAARLYGYAADDVLGKPAEMLMPARCRVREADILGRIMAGEEVERYRTERVCRDGTIVAVSMTISPIVSASGAVIGAATISRRIQEAHDRLELRLADQDGTAQDAADRFEAQVDHARDQTLQAQQRFDILVEQERSQAGAAAARFQVRIDAERAEAQSDKEHLEAQLQQGQRLEVLGQLAGGVAHDFNNLLGVILNYAAFVAEELAARPGSDLEAAGRDVEQIERAAQRAAALTHQLLAFARREVVRPRVLDLNHVVTDVQQLLDRTIGGDVMLHTDLAPDVWPVLADTGQIEQVLVNLAVNARDAMTGGGTLTIDTANINADAECIAAGSTLRAGRHVRLRVTDSGSGIPPEVAEHIFEPFYTTKPDGTGTGLGLATVYGIVTQAEATISVRSRLGVGTVFTIMLPVTDEIATAVPDEAPSTEHVPTGEIVLVVEDAQDLREVTERIFTRSGYRVISAANGVEALAIAADHDGDIHLLVTDVVMPNMLGKEVAEKIRQIKPDIQILYMSGYARPVLASKGRLDPDAHLIEKPFSAPALIQKAGQILRQ